MDLNTFLNKYGYANEYESLNDSNNKRKIYNRTILKRIAMIDEYTTLYKKLVSLYDEKISPLYINLSSLLNLYKMNLFLKLLI